MQVPARCSCGHTWMVSKDLVGGLTNCPRCGQAAKVEGLRDPFWRVIQVVAVVVWVLAVATLHANLGVTWALLGGLVLAGICALVYITL